MPDNGMDLVREMARNGQLEYVFSTPIFSHVLKGVETLNTQLRDLILEKECLGAGVARSNQGGWQSAPDFFRWDREPIAALEHYINHAINIASLRVTAQPNLKMRVELHGWAAVNRNGHYN